MANTMTPNQKSIITVLAVVYGLVVIFSSSLRSAAIAVFLSILLVSLLYFAIFLIQSRRQHRFQINDCFQLIAGLGPSVAAAKTESQKRAFGSIARLMVAVLCVSATLLGIALVARAIADFPQLRNSDNSTLHPTQISNTSLDNASYLASFTPQTELWLPFVSNVGTGSSVAFTIITILPSPTPTRRTILSTSKALPEPTPFSVSQLKTQTNLDDRVRGVILLDFSPPLDETPGHLVMINSGDTVEIASWSLRFNGYELCSMKDSDSLEHNELMSVTILPSSHNEKTIGCSTIVLYPVGSINVIELFTANGLLIDRLVFE